MAVVAYTRYALDPGQSFSARPIGAYLYFYCDTFAELPSGANTINGDSAYCADTLLRYARSAGAWTATTVNNVATWGQVNGTLSNQADLQTALNGKGTSNFSGAYVDLTGKPTLGTAAATAASAYATSAQGAKADTALQSIPAGTTAATSATTGTMTVSMTTDIVTITPTGACTFNASGGTTGRELTFSITTSGVSTFTLTWGTNFRKTGTLATGATSARFFTVTFRCLDGTVWSEIARTAVQT